MSQKSFYVLFGHSGQPKVFSPEIRWYLEQAGETLPEISLFDNGSFALCTKFGTDICFDERSIKVYQVCYPVQLDEAIVKKYLSCFFFDHIWGNEYCKMRVHDYVVDLLMKPDNSLTIPELRQAFLLSEKVQTKFMLDFFPRKTFAGIELIRQFHEACSKDTNRDCGRGFCECEKVIAQWGGKKTK
jgi:hypothetical protein